MGINVENIGLWCEWGGWLLGGDVCGFLRGGSRGTKGVGKGVGPVCRWCQ